MTWHVAWHDTAFDQMARIVRNHPDHKDELAAALRDLTAALRADPEGAGESRGDGLRITFHDPLVVDFQVAPADRRVLILNVRLRWVLL
ncbi:MAG: hypothetical protein C0501_04205 [Isosphaera sp.]|nr:hypothetical protein [Isosphaera sp.]